MDQELNHVLQALSDPTRLAILKSLAERPRAVGELAQGFPVSRPAVSQHLKVLKSAGLVTDQTLGNRRVYGIDARGIEALKVHFDKLWSSVLEGFRQAAEAPPVAPIKEPMHEQSRPKPRRRRPPHS